MIIKNYFNTLKLKKTILVLILFLILFEVKKSPIFATSIDIDNQIIACMQIKNISNSLELFMVENYSYPSTSEGLTALVINPDINEYPNHRRYIKKVPVDPWGSLFHYVKTNLSFEVFSFGADGISGGEDQNMDLFNHNCNKDNVSWFDKIFS